MRPVIAWSFLGLAAVGAVLAGVSGGDDAFAAAVGFAGVAIVAGIVANRPKRPMLWLALAAGLLIWSATLPFASSVIFAQTTFGTFLGTRGIGYVLMLVAVAILLYKTGRVRLGRADASLAFIGACTVVWGVALEPNLDHASAMPVAAAAAVLVDFLTLTLILRIAFTPTLAATSFRLVVAAAGIFTAGDVMNASPSVTGPASEHVIRVFYILGCSLVAAAALHPSMRAVPTAATTAQEPSARRTIALLSIALFTPFVGMVLNVQLEHEADPYIFGALGAVLVSGALARMARVVRVSEASEQKFRMMFEASGIGISLGTNGMLTETNDAYQRMLGYTADEMSRMHYNEITHPDDVGLDEDLAVEVAAGKRSSYSVEKRYVRRDGEARWVNVTVTMAKDRSFGIGMIEDITERRRLEEERQRLLARTVEVAEAERSSLAADLHDGPIQHLTAVTLTLDLLANKLGRGDAAGAKELAQQLRVSIADEMRSLRRLMTELRPALLDERGLEATLRDCADAVLDGEPVAFALDYGLNGHRLAPELEAVIYRVVREALTNVRKHANAQTARVSLMAEDGRVDLVVEDDGAGFVPGRTNGDHVGVVTMRERVESVGGRWMLRAAPGEGTQIRAVLPQKLRA